MRSIVPTAIFTLLLAQSPLGSCAPVTKAVRFFNGVDLKEQIGKVVVLGDSLSDSMWPVR